MYTKIITGKLMPTDWRLSRTTYLLVGIIILAAILRLLWLDRIPGGVGGDEIAYLFNIKSIILQGTDASGTWPWYKTFFFAYPPGEMQAELPYLLFLPIVGLLPFSLLTAHITNACLSIGIVLLLFVLGKKLANEHVGLATAFLAAINPWLIYSSRTAYEMIPAVFFYLVGIFLLLHYKSWKIFWSFPFFILAFYSYIATKVIFLPLILLSCLYICYKQKKIVLLSPSSLKAYFPYITYIAAGILFIVLFLILLKLNNPASRLSEIISPNDPLITKEVNTIRNLTATNTLVSLFENKYFILFTIIITKLFSILSPVYLFLQGDNFFSLWRHGLFYITDAFFLLTGIITMARKKIPLLIFLLIGSIITLIPHLLHGADTGNFTPHITMLFPFFLLIMGYGIWSILTITRAIMRVIVIVLILSSYIVVILHFCIIYFTQFPVYGHFDFYDRVAISYIDRLTDKQKVHIYTNFPYAMGKKYLLYTNRYNHQTAQILKKNWNTDRLKIGSIIIEQCDESIQPLQKEIVLYNQRCGLPKKILPQHRIGRLHDGGGVYYLYNEALCKNYTIHSFARKTTPRDYAIENLTNQTFCELFIVK